MDFLIPLFIGILAGTFTGLIPGIHINLISIILLSSITLFSTFPPLSLAIMIISMAITHSFMDFIPSIFLGAPEDDTFLSILPGHQMLKEGSAHEAIVLTLYGSLTGILIILIFTFPFIYLIPLIYSAAKFAIPFLLIFISIYLVLREEFFINSLIIFLLSGFIGFSALNLPVREPLLPVLTGLFGTSTLILSLKNKTKIAKQKTLPLKKITLPKKEFFGASLGAIFSAPLCSFLPGIGAGHAAIIGSELINQSKKSFFVLLGAINTIVLGLSFITIYSINKTRTGSAVAVKEILQEITLAHLGIFLLVIVLAGGIAFFLTLQISKFLSKKIGKINYATLTKLILFFLTTIIILFSNWLGLLVFFTSTFLGIFTIVSGVRRTSLMGCLLIPTIIFYLV
jgi:putative membrane protein